MEEHGADSKREQKGEFESQLRKAGVLNTVLITF